MTVDPIDLNSAGPQRRKAQRYDLEALTAALRRTADIRR
jgi:hypothetical protein